MSVDGRALEHASEELKDDREIVMIAVLDFWPAFQYASERLKGDRKFVIEVVLEKPWALKHASNALKGDQEVVMAAVSKDGTALTHATEGLKGDREVVTKAIFQNGLSVLSATNDMKGDEDVIRAALAASPADLVGLRVFLLSGRSCNQVFFHMGHIGPVLRRCAVLLGLDAFVLERQGSLMLGEVQITDLTELPPGQAHELTLVLS